MAKNYMIEEYIHGFKSRSIFGSVDSDFHRDFIREKESSSPDILNVLHRRLYALIKKGGKEDYILIRIMDD